MSSIIPSILESSFRFRKLSPEATSPLLQSELVALLSLMHSSHHGTIYLPYDCAPLDGICSIQFWKWPHHLDETKVVRWAILSLVPLFPTWTLVINPLTLRKTCQGCLHTYSRSQFLPPLVSPPIFFILPITIRKPFLHLKSKSSFMYLRISQKNILTFNSSLVVYHSSIPLPHAHNIPSPLKLSLPKDQWYQFPNFLAFFLSPTLLTVVLYSTLETIFLLLKPFPPFASDSCRTSLSGIGIYCN